MNVLKTFCTGLISPYILLKKYIDKSTKDVSVYKYTAITNDNKKETDYLCINENIINNFLVTENKKLVKIKTNKLIKYKYRKLNKKQISDKELVYFLVQVNRYLKVGNSLINSISLVIKKCKYKNLERILRVVRYDLMCGNDLSTALMMQGNSFPQLLIDVLKDKSISINEHLVEMEDYYKTLYLNEVNTIKLNIYKIFIVPYILMITMFILGYIIPKFYNLYKTFLDEDLVFLKKFLKFQKYDNIMYITFMIILFIYFILIILNNIDKLKIKFQRIGMKISKNIIDKEMVIYFRTLSLIIKYKLQDKGVINDITDNIYFNDLIHLSFNAYNNEHVISHILKDNKYFQGKPLEMIQSGEKFDSLLLQVNNISNYYQKLLDNNKKRTMRIIGPLIIIFSTLLFSSIIIILLFQSLMIIK